MYAHIYRYLILLPSNPPFEQSWRTEYETVQTCLEEDSLSIDLVIINVTLQYNAPTQYFCTIFVPFLHVLRVKIAQLEKKHLFTCKMT